MNLISNVLRKRNSYCALIPFITAGYPNIHTTIKALSVLDEKGADIIELGVPYADALADGPIIQESSRIALTQGFCLDDILYILKQVQNCLNTPIIVFTYYNPILVKGLNQFIENIAYYGAKGLIIPDLPLEETDYVISLCEKFNIELILFVSPTSSERRINSILSKSRGCIYLVSSTGVTGLRNHISPRINMLAQKIKEVNNQSVILGFGISNKEQAKEVSKWNIDGIVIGSAFMKLMFNKSPEEALSSLSIFCETIKTSISNEY